MIRVVLILALFLWAVGLVFNLFTALLWPLLALAAALYVVNLISGTRTRA